MCVVYVESVKEIKGHPAPYKLFMQRNSCRVLHHTNVNKNKCVREVFRGLKTFESKWLTLKISRLKASWRGVERLLSPHRDPQRGEQGG